MRICAAQTKPFKGDIEKNISQHLELLDQAIVGGADVVIFPELSITGYEPTLANELATSGSDPRFDVFEEVSNKHNLAIVIGAPLREANEVFIGMVIFCPDQPRTSYFKKHVFPTETPYFACGSEDSNFMIHRQNIGLAICYEISVQEHQQAAVDRGASMYLAGAVESVEGIDSALTKMANTAKKFSIPTLLANCVGISGEYNCAGRSSIWNRTGEMMGQLSKDMIGTLILDTNSGQILKTE